MTKLTWLPIRQLTSVACPVCLRVVTAPGRRATFYLARMNGGYVEVKSAKMVRGHPEYSVGRRGCWSGNYGKLGHVKGWLPPLTRFAYVLCLKETL